MSERIELSKEDAYDLSTLMASEELLRLKLLNCRLSQQVILAKLGERHKIPEGHEYRVEREGEKFFLHRVVAP